jgi:nitrogen regulatory protein PII
MEMHSKKRIEILLEAPAQKRLTDLLDRLDVTGYTVLPVIGGRGHHGVWSRDGLPSAAGAMVSVAIIVAEEKLDEVLEPVFEASTKPSCGPSYQLIEIVPPGWKTDDSSAQRS